MNNPQLAEWRCAVPGWAIQRVETQLDKLGLEAHARIDILDLARRAGLSKRLTKQCISSLRQSA